MESVHSSEAVINFYQTTRYHNPDVSAFRDDVDYGIAQWRTDDHHLTLRTREANQLKAAGKSPQIRRCHHCQFSSQGVLTRQISVCPVPQTNHGSFPASSSKHLKHKIIF
jgi:hypothetical protein